MDLSVWLKKRIYIQFDIDFKQPFLRKAVLNIGAYKKLKFTIMRLILQSYLKLCSFRNNSLKNILYSFLFCFVFLPFFSFSQDGINGPVINIELTEVDGFNQYIENEKIEIEFKLSNCETNSDYEIEYVIFRFKNKSSNKVKLRYFEHLWFNEMPATSNGSNESFREITLMPDEIFESNCFDEKKINLFSKFINLNTKRHVRQLTSFRLKRIEFIEL